MLTASVLLLLLICDAADYCHMHLICTVQPQPATGRQMYQNLQALHAE